MNEHDEDKVDGVYLVPGSRILLRRQYRLKGGKMDYGPFNKPWRMKLRMWEVVDDRDKEHLIEAHYCFNNGAEGLVFRTYPKGQDKTNIAAAFSQGGWKFYKEIV